MKDKLSYRLNKKSNILIVDDEPDNLVSIVTIFENAQENYEIYQALNAKLALKIVDKEKLDLIITDWEMPGINGIEFIKRLKQNPEAKDIPVIMCTGVMTSSENLETALKAGAVDYIRKPIDKIELIARVRSMLVLSASFQEIKSLNETKDKVFSIISHDLRSPLGGIKTMIDLLRKKNNLSDTEKMSKLLKLVSQRAGATFNLLENLLSWAKSQRGTINFEPGFHSFSSLVHENIELLCEGAKHKGISIENKINQEIKGYFDYNLISTVVRNLIANAVKFSSPGQKVTVNSEKKNDILRFEVIDKGTGLKKENIVEIFDPTIVFLTQGTAQESGSGMGLLLSKEFIGMHSGIIFADSQPGKGSTFYFEIPVIEQ